MTIAVLDSGVAYENHTDDHWSYVQAPSLASIPIVAPYDFVNGDAHPNDDHQHGTHIATSIVGRGTVEGVAPGATLMPLKVLDEHNSGSEVDLVDAIWHAVENGAQIINMSLSFHPDYVPSVALQEALDAAAEAGVLMVAAAGNNGLETTTWPAAHPSVMAVSAQLYATKGELHLPDYANRSGMVDVVAPGGSFNHDDNEDGLPDAIVAETIPLGDPTHVAPWMMAGTSQATALASGIAAYSVDAGVPPDRIRETLVRGSWRMNGEVHYASGYGAGAIDLWEGLSTACHSSATYIDPERVHAAVLPFIADVGDGLAAPKAEVVLTDVDGSPLAGLEVYATIAGTTASRASCITDLRGRCQLEGPPTAAFDPTGTPAPLMWSVTVDTVTDSTLDAAYRPRAVLFGSDALELAMTAAANEGYSDAILALARDGSDDPDLGVIVPGYTVLSSGTGLASSPMGLMFSVGALGSETTISDSFLDIDGTGLASSPMGFMPFTMLTFDGSGLASSPMGFTSLNLLAFSGTGLASSPMGFSWQSIITPDGGGLDDPALSLDGSMMELQSAELVGVDTPDSTLAHKLEDGGWVDGQYGLDGAHLLLGSGTMSVEYKSVETTGTSAGDGSAPLP